MDINQTLQERGERYGDFNEFSTVSQRLKEIMSDQKFVKLYQAEAIDMICHKLARIKTGDQDYIDSWHDIAGYAQLVVNELMKEQPTEQLSNAS